MATVGAFFTGFMPQMILGDYLFSLNTAAFQERERETNYRWAKQERFQNAPALQYLGPGDGTIKLPGVIYPSYKGGTGQVAQMRALAGKGEPLILLDGLGNVYGRWVIEKVTQKDSVFAPMGVPLKQEFTLELRHYDGGEFNAILDFLSSFL